MGKQKNTETTNKKYQEYGNKNKNEHEHIISKQKLEEFDTVQKSADAEKAFRTHVGAGFLRGSNRWVLVIIDALIYVCVALFMFLLFPGRDANILKGSIAIIAHIVLGLACVLVPSFLLQVYRQVWRYATYTSYLRLIFAFAIGGIFYILLQLVIPLIPSISVTRSLTVVAGSLLCCIVIRMLYQYMSIHAAEDTKIGLFYRAVLHAFGTNVKLHVSNEDKEYISTKMQANRIRIAVIGAGRTGMGLVQEMSHNDNGRYVPVCFIDNSSDKIGRIIGGLPIFDENEITREKLDALGVQEVVIAIPDSTSKMRKYLFNLYSNFGRKVLAYDYPLQSENELGYKNSKNRMIREINIEELLFRSPVTLNLDAIKKQYQNKVVLVTGGGGSIGSELVRQVAAMQPKKLIVLDIAENGVYDIKQEMLIKYGEKINVCIEICNMCNYEALKRVFCWYKPHIVLHAAAHKHVPLMENNVIEAIENNIFGSYNVMQLCLETCVERFCLISTDKAVNPTNVMGATKRMCEMIMQVSGNMANKQNANTVFSAVRFGNVLGSSGSVVPLFRRQIIAGGPVTITHKDIIRYFMTIPEAVQLVLESSIMASNGELFVLDMGEPVRIYDLAENMISLMGFIPGKEIKIKETGLRPGEKLFEELLIDSENVKQKKTENNRIFIDAEEDILSSAELTQKLTMLKEACINGDDENARNVLRICVPTFRNPDEVNKTARQAVTITQQVNKSR